MQYVKFFFLDACSKKTYFGVRNFNPDAFILQFDCVEMWSIGTLRYNEMSLYVVEKAYVIFYYIFFFILPYIRDAYITIIHTLQI